MKDKILKIQRESLEAIIQCKKLQELIDYKVKYLGKKGKLTTLLRGMGELSPKERPIIGSLVNEVRDNLDAAFEKRIKSRVSKKIRS